MLESRLGRSVVLDGVDSRTARHMLRRVRSIMAEARQDSAFHRSERSAGYLRAVMLEQALTALIKEQDTDLPIDMTDPKVKSVMDKIERKQNLTPDEQSMANQIAASKSKTTEQRRRIREQAEVQQAQVVLASQDMIDRIQGMIEDVSEMQFKDLPALVDGIKQDTGVTQAQQYQTTASQALASLLQAIQAAKQQMETAQGAITGEQMQVPGETPVGEPAEPAAPADADLGPDLALPPEEEEAVPDTGLGRERR